MGLLCWIMRLLVPTFQFRDDDVVVFVVGPSGSGKSMFVEQVTKSNLVKVGAKLRPCTATVQAIRCELTEGAKAALGVTMQESVVFVDTPSFHSFQSDKAALAAEEMRSWLNNSKFNTFKSTSTFVGIVYMHRVETDPRYEPIQPHLDAFAHTFPSDFFSQPRRLHAVLSYEGTVSEGTVGLRREMLEAQLRALRPSHWLGKQLKWVFSLHEKLFRFGDAETAWQAVVALFVSLSPNQSNQQD